MNDPADQNQKLALASRLSLLDAINAALDRRAEVLRVIEDSEDEAEAVAAVRSMLSVDEVCARAVLMLQWSRLTRSARARIADERLDVTRRLDML